MWQRDQPAPKQAFAPPETRIYAVGDIHGRADLLADILDRIDDDLHRRPIANAVEVYLGDYIDRGPDSKSVIDLLEKRAVAKARKPAVDCLPGRQIRRQQAPGNAPA